MTTLGFTFALLWISAADTYSLSQSADVYNNCGWTTLLVLAALALLLAFGGKAARSLRAVCAIVAGAATLCAIVGLVDAALLPALFPIQTACAVPLACAWAFELSRYSVNIRSAIVCAASIAAVAVGYALNEISALPAVSAAAPLASAVCLTVACRRTIDERDARPDVTRPQGLTLFVYTVCACTLLASIFCGVVASPIAGNSQTPFEIFTLTSEIGLALLLAACIAGSKAKRTPSSLFVSLQIFAGLFEVVFVAGLLLLSTSQAGTMTTSVGLDIGARQCLMAVCWIVLPEGARCARGTSLRRLAALMFGCGLLYATFLGAELDRSCMFTFQQLTNLTTACIAAMAVIAVLYATLRGRAAMAKASAPLVESNGADDGTKKPAAAAGANAGENEPVAGEQTADDKANAHVKQATDEGTSAPDGHNGRIGGNVDAEEATARIPRMTPDVLKLHIKEMRLAELSPYDLTERETQIVLLLLDGQTMKGVAEELFITERTVKFHSKNAYVKLGVANKKELMKKFTDMPAQPSETLRPSSEA